MKKITFSLMLLLMAAINHVSAQTRPATTEIAAARLTDGKNTVRLPDGSGSFQFVKRGDTFSDVVFVATGGTTTRLVAMPGSSAGPIPTPCKYPIPDACYGIPNSSKVAMCFCKPTDKSSGQSSGEYTITYAKATLTARKAGSDRGE